MIDFTLGLILGGLLTFAFFHFKGESPAKAPDFLTNLETRIRAMITDALNDLKTAYEADKAKAVADALAGAADAAPAAAQAQEAADEQAVRDFTAANFPAPAE